MENILKNEKLMIFAGGVVAGTLGLKALKSKTAKKIYVSTLANGMKLQQDAQNLFETMKEDAQDICYEARKSSVEDSVSSEG
ncbi:MULTISPECIES: DUF6110 family protein [Clostridium]|uniref:DUF6110 family protein n=1 Tax=Clostridium aquiflavi TaxID=3073603 RepID=A0ABU1EG45_9CLOT|nr:MULTISPECIES: DUF6110 family protein [unclassified Clostridium]MDR5587234.1 DUF6110 family protein [Clostridium sp. 5N-1]NFG61649.1 DUF1490 domain-containing protein [Clostridium botulinum]NFQ08434.1 DUF1490 domain-containing protein [Clostridium botulinum]